MDGEVRSKHDDIDIENVRVSFAIDKHLFRVRWLINDKLFGIVELKGMLVSE